MANRSKTNRGTGGEQEPARQSDTAAQRGTGQPGTGSDVRTDRERSVQTTRDVDRATSRDRGMTTRPESRALQRRGAPMTSLGGPAASPFSLMRRMMDDMDRLFENVGLGRGMALSPWGAFDEFDDLMRPSMTGRGTAMWAPPLEIFERGDQLVVRADLPGLSKDNVNVEVDNGVLTVSGERHQDYEDAGEGYYRSERSYGTFARSIPLPEGVTEEQCNATFKDGVLEVTFPKPEGTQSRRRRIDIK